MFVFLKYKTAFVFKKTLPEEGVGQSKHAAGCVMLWYKCVITALCAISW